MYRLRVLAALASCSSAVFVFDVGAASSTIAGPPGSGSFGRATVLPNANIVVTDPLFDLPDGTQDVGAVYLYEPDGTLISRLTGSSAGDRVGLMGVTVLASGNYVITSQAWGEGRTRDLGAVTFGDASTGVSGVVGPTNSLVGSTAGDGVGYVTALDNGNYLVQSANWDNAGVVNAGFVAFGDGETGLRGVVSAANALVGTTQEDRVGQGSVTLLTNGNYVVATSSWHRGAVLNAGAVTFGDATVGVVGEVGPHNSLVGTSRNDLVGDQQAPVVRLANGNYVVRSPVWDDGVTADVGAATFCNGVTGTVGVVGAANSLVGSTAGDRVGTGVMALTNGNYVVQSPKWSRGAMLSVGAITWASGATGMSGPVTAANSLLGSTAGDAVGSLDGTPLANGNYVISSPNWDSGATQDVGAATFGNGSRSITGTVSVANSLIGSSALDGVGKIVRALSDGNYVVLSSGWNNGAIANVGAVTFGDGAIGTAGVVDAGNSLIGSQTDDRVGLMATALHDGAYLVHSPNWHNGAVVEAGALTFIGAQDAKTGVVSASNSLVGSSPTDVVGISPVKVLANGNYVVFSPTWDNGNRTGAGAVTLGDGKTGVQGPITQANSIVGTLVSDRLGAGQLVAFSNSDFVIGSPYWSEGGINHGAATYLSGSVPTSGVITPLNSLLGASPNDHVGDVLQALPDGRYAIIVGDMDVASPNGVLIDAGAVVIADGVGEITADNTVFGKHANTGDGMNVSGNGGIVAVGRPGDNEVSVFGLADESPLPEHVFGDGFE